MMQRIVFALSVGLLLAHASLPARAQDDAGVPDARYARLARGINLPFWFWYAPPDDRLDDYFTTDDFATIRALGFTFVRLPIDLGFVRDPDDETFIADHLALVDHAVALALANDLAVVIDLHSTSLADSDAANYSASLEDSNFAAAFVTFWGAFAAHFADTDPDSVIFEPMNEPVFYDDPTAWLPIQARLAAAIRAAAPQHTILVTGARWSGMDTLLDMTPLDDPNLIYNFHFYEPFPFTHQGATWSSPEVEPMRNVPYPSSPDLVAPLVDALQGDHPSSADWLRWYGEERWDAAKIADRIGQAAAWGARYGVRLMCSEFGVYAAYAPPADRARWIHDTRATFERYGISWAMWEYDSGFGVVTRANGVTTVDTAVAAALGLAVP